MLLVRLILRTLVGMLGLWLAQKFVPGVSFTDSSTMLVAALVLGVINALVRPVVILLTLPLTLVTLGLFLLVVNAGMFALAAWLLEGFRVDTPQAALLGGLVVSLVSWIGHMIIGPNDDE